MRKRTVRMLGNVVLSLTLLLGAQSLFAAEQAFYAGRTIHIIAGFAPGGTIDLRARLFARHLSKYIPGNPSIVVQNMVGAGGLTAANYVFSVAKPDGLTLLHFPSSTVMNTFLTPGPTVKYDIRQVPIICASCPSLACGKYSQGCWKIFNPRPV